MKVLLINTPRSPFNAILDYAPASAKRFIHKKLIGPPLGLLTVAAALNDHDVVLLETKAAYDLMENQGKTPLPSLKELVLNALEENKPDVVGVTFIASEFTYGLEIFDIVKGYDPKIVTVAGGLHTSLCPDDFYNPSIDIVCPGEAVKKIRGILIALEKRRPVSLVPGVYVRGENGLEFTGKEASVDSAVADYLVPKRELVNPWLSTYQAGKIPGPGTYLFSSLGCPNKCTFCSIWPQYNGTYRERDVESIVAELKGLHQYPSVRFADANTLVNKGFLERLFTRIKQEGIKKYFVMDMRVDAVAENPKLIELLAKGGLKVVISGFESFRNNELKKYNKSSDAKLIAKAIDIFHQNDIMIRGNYVIPPDYDKDDFKALRDYAGSNRVAYAGYTILTPMPGTILYKEMKDQIVDPDLRKYNFFNCVVKTKLPLEKFYEEIAEMWTVRKGKEVL